MWENDDQLIMIKIQLVSGHQSMTQQSTHDKYW